MRVLVTGDREWADVFTILIALYEVGRQCGAITALAHGDCRGADTLAAKAFRVHGDHGEICAFPANWDRDGKAAGPIRNRAMFKAFKPDLVLAFHDDLKRSKGTADMVSVATGKVPVWVYDSQANRTVIPAEPRLL